MPVDSLRRPTGWYRARPYYHQQQAAWIPMCLAAPGPRMAMLRLPSSGSAKELYRKCPVLTERPGPRTEPWSSPAPGHCLLLPSRLFVAPQSGYLVYATTRHPKGHFAISIFPCCVSRLAKKWFLLSRAVYTLQVTWRPLPGLPCPGIPPRMSRVAVYARPGIPNVACKVKCGKGKRGGMIGCASNFFLVPKRLAELEILDFSQKKDVKKAVAKCHNVEEKCKLSDACQWPD